VVEVVKVVELEVSKHFVQEVLEMKLLVELLVVEDFVAAELESVEVE